MGARSHRHLTSPRMAEFVHLVTHASHSDEAAKAIEATGAPLSR